MIPKVEFKRSWIYDHNLRALHRKGFKFPESKIIEVQTTKLEKLWSKEGSSILKEMARVLKLKWYQKTTTCYITAGIPGFSDPLTIGYNKDVTKMFDTLTHEMIHRLWSEEENWKVISKNWFSLQKKHKRLSITTRSHFTLMAVHAHLFKKFYNDKRLLKEMEAFTYPDYIKAWAIVKKEGYQNIIYELTKGR